MRIDILLSFVLLFPQAMVFASAGSDALQAEVAGPLDVQMLLGLTCCVSLMFAIDAIFMFQLMRAARRSIGVPDAGPELRRRLRRSVVSAWLTLCLYIGLHGLEAKQQAQTVVQGGDDDVRTFAQVQVVILVLILFEKLLRILSVQFFGKWLDFHGGFIPSTESQAETKSGLPPSANVVGAPNQEEMVVNATVVNATVVNATNQTDA